MEQECLNNCDRWPGLREEITIFLLKFATLPWQGDASLHCLGLPRLRIKSALFFISPLAGSSLWFKSTFHPAWNVHFEGRSFNSLSLKTRQTQKEKESRSMLAVPGSVTWGWQGPSAGRGRDTPSPPPLPRDWNYCWISRSWSSKMWINVWIWLWGQGGLGSDGNGWTQWCWRGFPAPWILWFYGHISVWADRLGKINWIALQRVKGQRTQRWQQPKSDSSLSGGKCSNSSNSSRYFGFN